MLKRTYGGQVFLLFKAICLTASLFYSNLVFAETGEIDPEEQRIGYFVDYFTTRVHGKITDEQITRPIKKLVEDIVRATEKPDMSFTVRVLNDPLYVNASVAPGGYIYVGRGLLDMLSRIQSEMNVDPRDELAAVLAHEVAHGIHDHPISTIRRLKRLGDITQGLRTIGTIGGLAAGAMAGYSLGTSATSGLYGSTQEFYTDMLTRIGAGMGISLGNAFIGSTSKMIAILLHQGFSRNYERDADQQGIKYLSLAGYDPKAVISLYQKFDRVKRMAQRNTEHVHHFLSSEYTLAERIKYVSRQVLGSAGK